MYEFASDITFISTYLCIITHYLVEVYVNEDTILQEGLIHLPMFFGRR